MEPAMIQPNTLDADLAIIAQATSDKQSILEEISNLTNKLETIKVQVSESEKILITKTDNITSANIAQNELNEKYNTITSEIIKAEEMYNAAQQKKLEAEDIINDCNVNIVKAKSETETTKSILKTELYDLEQTINTLKPKKLDLTEEVHNLSGLKVSLESNVETLQKKCKEFITSIDLLNNTKTQLMYEISQRRAELQTILNTTATSTIELHIIINQINDKNEELKESLERLEESEKQQFAYARTRAEFEGRVAFIKDQFKKAGVPWPAETQ